MKFKEYKSRPIIRKALEITDEHVIGWHKSTNKAVLSIKGKEKVIGFTCHQKPKVGDFIVYLNDEDIYHCSREVFENRNYLD